MSPEKANVFIAEDNSSYQKLVKEYLEEAGHTLSLSATTIEEALACVDRFEELGIDVAVLDGNLSENEYNGYEGQMIRTAIRDKAPNVKIVGMSGNKFPGADVDLGKRKVDELGDVVTKL